MLIAAGWGVGVLLVLSDGEESGELKGAECWGVGQVGEGVGQVGEDSIAIPHTTQEHSNVSGSPTTW